MLDARLASWAFRALEDRHVDAPAFPTNDAQTRHLIALRQVELGRDLLTDEAEALRRVSRAVWSVVTPRARRE
jgi:hypothetical protein